MKRIYLPLVLLLVACGCGRDGASIGGQKIAAGLAPSLNPKIAVAQFTPDGKRVVVTSKDGTAQIWDAQTGKPLPQVTNGAVQVWDLSNGQPALPRYDGGTPDHMPVLGGDNFKVLQDQIDGLEKRVQALEKKISASGR